MNGELRVYHKKIYRYFIKRLLDIILSTLALVILSPLLFITALFVRIKLGSPVVFKQARPGMHEKIFYLYKFRSMTNEVGEDGRLLPDAQRLTKFGKFLRASSLDELLELFNIIKGDMSIVGPRPLSIYYLPHYPADLRRRHEVRPGLTGLAQVNGRNNLPWDERFALDIKYVDAVSFVQDVKIVFSTVSKVLKHAGISVRGTANVKDYGPYSILKEQNDGGKKVAGMTYSEIGSYFWLDRQKNGSPAGEISWLPSTEDSCFTFSGRNAIDLVLRDILKEHVVKKVYAPSYCCVSMLQAFFDRGLTVGFYEVGIENGRFIYEMPKTDSNTIVLIMSYFGLRVDEAHEVIQKMHENGAIVIEDVTHSLLSGKPFSEYSDYLVASLRKWFAVPTGGWAGKRQGLIADKPTMDSNHAVEEKVAAMYEKYDYLTGKIESKEKFLLANAKFDNDLIHVDRMLRMDDTSLGILKKTDVNNTVKSRRENVKVLLNGLKDMTDVLTVPEVNLDIDTPLFLPIFMKTENRDKLRRYLIEKGIYCPIHWPEVMGASVGIRANELSLICDQRYSEGDMQAIIEAVHACFKTHAENKEELLVSQ